MHNLKNNLKTAFLMGLMMGLVLLVGSFWGRTGLVFAFGFGVIMNFGAWFFSDKLAIAAMQGREVDEHSAPQLYAMVDRLRQRAGLPMPRVFVCPHDAPNAFATGRNPSHAAVAVTRGILDLLDERELEGVISHELAHVKNRDTLTSCVAATIAGVLAMIAHSFMWFGGGLGGSNREGSNPLLAILSVIIAAVGAALIQSMISRSREFAADADGAMIAGTPVGLASALTKLEMYSKRIPLNQPNPAQNNLFIVEPFSGGRGTTLVNMFASHPPVEARIAALHDMWEKYGGTGNTPWAAAARA